MAHFTLSLLSIVNEPRTKVQRRETGTLDLYFTTTAHPGTFLCLERLVSSQGLWYRLEGVMMVVGRERQQRNQEQDYTLCLRAIGREYLAFN